MTRKNYDEILNKLSSEKDKKLIQSIKWKIFRVHVKETLLSRKINEYLTLVEELDKDVEQMLKG